MRTVSKLATTASAKPTMKQLKDLLIHVENREAQTIKEIGTSQNPQAKEVALKARARKDLVEAILRAMDGNLIDLKMYM